MSNQTIKEMSNTKRTLLVLLNQEIDELQDGVRSMKEEDLIKNVAKRKVSIEKMQVIYNISRQGQIELIYALIALAEFYIGRQMFESALRAIEQSRNIQIVGDSTYLMANVYLKKGMKKQAQACYEQCIKQQWIQPSEQHKAAAKLQAMTQLQQLFFDLGSKDKLIQLSYEKIRLTRQTGARFSQNYFHALSLADMGVIHEAFGEFPQALQKIEGALTILQGCGEEPAKQIELLKIQSTISSKMGKVKGQSAFLQKALSILSKFPNCIDEKSEIDLLEKYIESHLFN